MRPCSALPPSFTRLSLACWFMTPSALHVGEANDSYAEVRDPALEPVSALSSRVCLSFLIGASATNLIWSGAHACIRMKVLDGAHQMTLLTQLILPGKCDHDINPRHNEQSLVCMRCQHSRVRRDLRRARRKASAVRSAACPLPEIINSHKIF